MPDPNQIAADIELANSIITPWVASFNPAIGAGLGLALDLLAEAEPAVYKAIAAAISGKALTPEQEFEKNEAITRLQNPASYFE